MIGSPIKLDQAAAAHIRDCLERQVQHLQQQVDGFNANEWDDDATDAVDQQIPAQQRPCSDWAVLDPA
jgi:hypothetical protein